MISTRVKRSCSLLRGLPASNVLVHVLLSIQFNSTSVREIIDVLFSFIHNKLLVFNRVLTLLRIILLFFTIISRRRQRARGQRKN